MSYTQHYTGSVEYSGSVSYNYPASEYGGSGTAYYSGSVPVSININVDTDPFDRSVDNTNTALAAVAGALTTAEAMQVQAIQESGEMIASAATRGFFRILGSELSSQITEFSSTMKSCVGLLVEEGQAIDNVHHQMEQDYNSIKSRYMRVFDELDRELDRRVRELDQAAFRISTQAMDEVVEAPFQLHAAGALLQAEDSSVAPIKLQCARAKSIASSAIESLGDACGLISDYSVTVKDVMDDKASRGVAFAPVLFSIHDDLLSNGERIDIVKSQTMSSESVKGKVITFVSSRPSDAWVSLAPEDHAAVDRSFTHLVEDYAAAQPSEEDSAFRQRVSQLIYGLYRQTDTQTTYANR